MAKPPPEHTLASYQHPADHTVMSFAHALKPTPSEISVASTAYTTTGASLFEEDAPPVPPIPLTFAAPTDDADHTPRPRPQRAVSMARGREHVDARPDRPERQDDASQSLPTCCDASDGHGMVAQPAPAFNRMREDRDMALARLEESSIIDLSPEEREQRRYDKWLRRQARQQARVEDKEAEWMRRYERWLRREARKQARLEAEQREQQKLRTVDPLLTHPVSTAVRPQHQPNPGRPTKPSNKLRELADRAKKLIKGPPKQTHFDYLKGMVDSDPALKAALNGRPIPGSRFDYKARSAADAKREQAYVQAFLTLGKTDFKAALQDPATAPWLTWNGLRTSEDGRPPLPAMLSVGKAERQVPEHREVGLPSGDELTDKASPTQAAESDFDEGPRRPVFHEVVWDDAPETPNNEMPPTSEPRKRKTPAPPPLSLPPHDPTNTEPAPPPSAATLAATYQAAISPMDFASHGALPAFTGEEWSVEQQRVLDKEAFGDEVSKMRREDRLAGFRARNARRESFAWVVEGEGEGKGVGEETWE